ncbi:N-acetyltransferase [Erwinia endophytica]|uniref:GNAT family N-acetyltransferase n=1 Tax=Erwinia endophytica TaxID=1563158 RepID=UPI001265F367|nr:GNAT family N-acetyltransferase [Erwinia endophytica]KAB8308243.1 N-acetyltransferase [Erwinia endophytica]
MNLVFRPYTNTDAKDFASAVIASLDTLRPWLVWAHEDFTEAEARQWFATTHTLRQTGAANELGLFAEDGRLLGGAGLRYSSEQTHHCSIGYWVRSSEQGRGIASQAVRYLVDLAWQSPERDIVEILAAEENAASRRVATKCGADFIGIQYGLIMLDSGPVNTAIYHFRRPQ